MHDGGCCTHGNDEADDVAGTVEAGYIRAFVELSNDDE